MGHVVSGGPAVMSPTQVLASCLCQPQCWLKERGALLSPSVEFFNRLAPSVVHRAACYYFVDSWIVLFSCSRIWPKLPKGVSPVSPSVTSTSILPSDVPVQASPISMSSSPEGCFPSSRGWPSPLSPGPGTGPSGRWSFCPLPETRTSGSLFLQTSVSGVNHVLTLASCEIWVKPLKNRQ